MRINTLTLLAALGGLGCLAPLVSATIGQDIEAHQAIVVNHCAFPVYLWSVGQAISSEHNISSNGSYAEVFHIDPVTGGIAIKVTRDPQGLYDGAAQLLFQYSLAGSTVWYNVADVSGDPFAGKRVAVVPNEESCPSIVWSDGVPPASEQIASCNSAANLVLTLC